ncbi:Gfo/Idh/MocA family protein [Paenarthrobacter ureafaciens]|uniref:Gfo/Idh/MocA family protein n=1 Tax=Paenarthrobacter ureafaciens TaxID=37931 RepID=UPI002DB84429|nr:Gfo/Idh/MocA family oxidoreductase [Paenarthrobacter ureafaciens]MEC3853662.1 Gfo/Idh/MocA family oxidoreductase [Paenarthrobacter ureafaciens]
MKEIRVALIGGGGFMGRAHSLGYSVATQLSDVDFRVRKAMLVDVDAGAAALAADALGWEDSSADWRSVVASPDIDAVDIVTPPGLHKEIALAAIAHGKHVFCEKPITNDVAGALEMWDAAREGGITNQVGFNYRHIPAISHIKELLSPGKLGFPLQFRGTYLHDALFFMSDFGWRGSKATGGSGATGDIGSHLIDIAEYLCGPITRVSALQVSRDRTHPDSGWRRATGGEVEDPLDEASTWIAQFENGTIGTFSAGFYSPGKKNALTFEIDATRGGVAFDWNNPDQLVVDLLDDPAAIAGPRTVEVSQNIQGDVWYPVPGLGQGYIDGMAIQLRRFLQAIADECPASPNFGEAVRIQQVIDAIEESASTKAWVTMPDRPKGI